MLPKSLPKINVAEKKANPKRLKVMEGCGIVFPRPIRQERRLQMATHNLSMKDEMLELIAEGTKTAEVRVGYASIREIRPGDTIVFASSARWAEVRVLATRRYSSFEHMLRFEDSRRILPGAGRAELLNVLRDMMGDKDRRLMVYVFDIVLIGAREQ